MPEHRFEFGDRVRHVKRPEWGVGSILKTEDTSVNGQPFQRITVRFPNAGVKRLMSGHALIQRVESDEEQTMKQTLSNGPSTSNFGMWDSLTESDWLSPLAQRKIREVMTTLPEEIRDPFNPFAKRLAATLNLYRFNRTGRALVDWAVAQSGLKDPLSRFSRQELEQLFDRWSHELDGHLAKLLNSATSAGDRNTARELLRSAPPAARTAIKRATALR
jgi:hypothetical protein